MRRADRRGDCSGNDLFDLLVTFKGLLALVAGLRLVVAGFSGLPDCRRVGLVVSWSFGLAGVILLLPKALSEGNGDFARCWEGLSGDDITPNSKLNIESF